MSEETFSWFKRPKKREISPKQEPLDLLTQPNLKISDFDALMERMREQQTYALRTLFPGTYKADDLTLLVSGQLPSYIFDLVLQHEYIHALFSQQHYGEMIRRLESFGILVALPLLRIRGLIILEMLLEEQGPNYKFEQDEKFSQAEQEFMRRVALDESTRQRIRERLASDQIFIRGLGFLDKIDKKKNLLLAYWKKAQEGGAYWVSLHDYEQHIAEHDDIYKREATELVKTVKAKLLQAKDENGEGFRMVQEIAKAWGDRLVYLTLYVIMSPDITQLSILHASLPDISQKLTTRFSPDHRLEAVYHMAVSGSFVPQNQDNVFKLYNLLDPDNPTPNLSIDGFNAYWNTLDADTEFISLMNDLYQRAGIELEYKPIQIPKGGIGSYPSEISASQVADVVTLMDHEARILQKGAGESGEFSRRKVSMDKDIFLETMRREGLVYLARVKELYGEPLARRQSPDPQQE